MNYRDFLSASLLEELLRQAKPVTGVPGLTQVGEGGGLETRDGLAFLVELHQALRDDLAQVLSRRAQDRKFIDERVRACLAFNRDLGRDLRDRDYKTVIGLEDAEGRVVIGPLTADAYRAGGKPVAPIPDFLQGPHVTLFGPPDTAKMAINAMNSYHRKLENEPAIVEELLRTQKSAPKWGADDEDSKTPLRADLIDAAVNLTGCFEGTLSLQEGKKSYELARENLAQPIKRFPGLALPSTFLFNRGEPVPLHLYDFALHFFRNWNNPKALVFYVPKLENEEEARYLHKMIATAEEMLRARHPSYAPGTVRLMIVLENPRAILRAHEIMDALHPYFAGASLGWHDYLASTARLFKEDSNYRIPVKADPGIVIKYIQASHRLLADVVGSRGGIKVGGMYGILPLPGNRESLQITLKGFFKDVITQMKRDLTGFWVAHPDFVRLGLALVEAWRRHATGDSDPLQKLVTGLLDEMHASEVLAFIAGTDSQGLDLDDPNYVRSLLVADIKESDFIANNHPDEIRYNVFQSLQYLTDWLSGNGCVALPTIIDGIPVRVMDDLATAERSRWEVWHELRHGRFALEDFIQIAHEEMNFIRRDLSDDRKIVQVKWDERTAKWYPVAFKLMLKLMTDREPVEFATELLLPFTIDAIRSDTDPWNKALKLAPEKFRLDPYVADYDHYFEICGSQRFARTMALRAVEDLAEAEKIVLGFSLEEILSAAGFHGDIGQSRKTLDPRAASEQSGVSGAEQATLRELSELGQAYRARHGFKFLVSAKGKSAAELLAALKARIENDTPTEMRHAREALWEISRKRLSESPRDLLSRLEALRTKHGIAGVQIAINFRGYTQTISLGEREKGKQPVTRDTAFELASLSKTVASAFAIEYFRSQGIPLTAPVNELLAQTHSRFRLRSPRNPGWADQVTLAQLMSHSALGMHYVRGIGEDHPMPRAGELLDGNAQHGYDPVQVICEPGREFHYSGGGFLVLEHLIEAREKKPIQELTQPFLEKLGLQTFTFEQRPFEGELAHGYFDDGKEVPGGRLSFPAFAAGSLGSARDMAAFLSRLTEAFRSLEGSGPISHDTAVEMLHGTDRGCRAFMGCDMGLGVFTAEAGQNRLAIHQGANEGFRAIYLQCYDGPDRGKGAVVLCNGDNRGVIFIAEAMRELLKRLEIQGVDQGKLTRSFNFRGLAQEQIVNLGYKALIFDAFQPDLPEKIVVHGEVDPLAGLNLSVNARIVDVSNQKFARAENLLSAQLPVFDPGLFGRQGKVMDSWESARHNPEGADWLELELAKPSAIRYVSLSTKFHDGNQAEFVRIRSLQNGAWSEFLPKTPMKGHSLLRLDLGESETLHSRLKIEIFPDGGLSRLGLFEYLPEEFSADFLPPGQALCARFEDAIPKTRKPLTIPYAPPAQEIQANLSRARKIDLAGLAFGGRVARASNEHYGPAAQVISPFPPIHMFDGLESARSREPGHQEEVLLDLARPSKVSRILMDFAYFVNNNPLEVDVHGLSAGRWIELVSRTRVKAFAGNQKLFAIASAEELTQLRVRTFPDGGINRIRVY